VISSPSSIVYFWFHVEWPSQYLRLASIQSLVLYPALSAYFDIIKNERHGVHVTQLCQDADDDWLSLASNICFMTQHDRLLLAFFSCPILLREKILWPPADAEGTGMCSATVVSVKRRAVCLRFVSGSICIYFLLYFPPAIELTCLSVVRLTCFVKICKIFPGLQ
jgi:hypothetical protein